MGEFEDRKYIIIPYAELTDNMLDNCLTHDRDSLRHSISGEDRIVVECLNENIGSFEGFDIFDYDEILTIVNDPEGDW